MLFYSGLNFTPSSKCVTTLTKRREKGTEREREKMKLLMKKLLLLYDDLREHPN